VSNIQDNQARIARTYTRIWQLVASDSVSGPVTVGSLRRDHSQVRFPYRRYDAEEQPLFWKELGGISSSANDPKTLKEVTERVKGMKARKGEIPIYVDSVVIYKLFTTTSVGRQLRLIPVVELAMVIGFIILALIGFSTSGAPNSEVSGPAWPRKPRINWGRRFRRFWDGSTSMRTVNTNNRTPKRSYTAGLRTIWPGWGPSPTASGKSVRFRSCRIMTSTN